MSFLARLLHKKDENNFPSNNQNNNANNIPNNVNNTNQSPSIINSTNSRKDPVNSLYPTLNNPSSATSTPLNNSHYHIGSGQQHSMYPGNALSSSANTPVNYAIKAPHNAPLQPQQQQQRPIVNNTGPLKPAPEIIPINPNNPFKNPFALPVSAPASATPTPSHNIPPMHIQQPAPTANVLNIDDICRMSVSSNLNDQLTSSKLFCEIAAHGDARRQEELSQKAMRYLTALTRSNNTTIQTHVIQTIALLARNEHNHPYMFEHSILQVLIGHITNKTDRRVLEAALAALTHLAKREHACNNIVELGLNKIIPLLKVDSIGVQCNTLALLGAIATIPSLLDRLLEADILHQLFYLRDHSVQSDIQQNSRYCLTVMGYTDKDPTQTHKQCLQELLNMGFPRGRCELAIKKLRKLDSSGNIISPDLQRVMCYLLDHGTDNINSPQSQISQSHAQLNNTQNPFHSTPRQSAVSRTSDNIKDLEKEPSVSSKRQHSSLLQENSHILLEKQSSLLENHQNKDQNAKSSSSNIHRLTKEEKSREKSRVEKDRQSDIESLTDMGFSYKSSVLALLYNVSLDRAIEWLFELQSRKEERKKAKQKGLQIVPMQQASSNSSNISTPPDLFPYDSDLDSDEENNNNKDDRERSVSVPEIDQANINEAIANQADPFSIPGSHRNISAPIQPPPPPPTTTTTTTTLPTHNANRSSNSNQPQSPSPGAVPNSSEDAAIIDWLIRHGFSEYKSQFLSQSIGVDTLIELSESDLERMGIVTLGARKRILRAIRSDFTPHNATHNNNITTSQSGSSSPITKTRPTHNLPAPHLTHSTSLTGLSETPTHNTTRPPQLLHSSSELSPTASASANINDSIIPGEPEPVLDEKLLAPPNLVHSRSASYENLSVSRHISPSSSSSYPLAAKGSLHFAFLQAQPLRHSEVPGISKRLNLSKETQVLQDALNESGRCYRCIWEVATKDNLLKMMTYARALHISGHGDPNSMVLEDGKGDTTTLSVDILRNILNVGGTGLKFVFVSSCFSSRAAEAFAQAGVPHVIAVQEDTQVTDNSAMAFTAHVYLALCQGLSVIEAFKKGRAAVIAANTYNPPCCCAHLHQKECRTCDICRTPVCCRTHASPCHAALITSCCHPNLPHDESLKFLLLPKDAPHDVQLFEDVEEGHWIDKTPPKPPNNLPSLPDHFLGRARDAAIIVPLVLKYRLFTITGLRGIGKSALARAVATFINERRHFHASYIIRLDQTKTCLELLSLMCRVLKLETPNSIQQTQRSWYEIVVEYLNGIRRDNRSVLFVFDDCDQLMDSNESKAKFREFLRQLLDDTTCTIVITADKSAGNIAGHTQRVYNLEPLHPLDSIALFLNRLPRELKRDDLKQLGQIKSLDDFLPHPLFKLINGIPRLAEYSAELLNYCNLDEIVQALTVKPIIDQDNKVQNSAEWQHFPEPAKALLRSCITLLVQFRSDKNSPPSSTNLLTVSNPSLNSTPISPISPNTIVNTPQPANNTNPVTGPVIHLHRNTSTPANNNNTTTINNNNTISPSLFGGNDLPMLPSLDPPCSSIPMCITLSAPVEPVLTNSTSSIGSSNSNSSIGGASVTSPSSSISTNSSGFIPLNATSVSFANNPPPVPTAQSNN